MFYTGLRCYEDSLIGFYDFGIAPNCNYTTSVDENILKNSFKIYPNPAMDKIIIEGPENEYQIIISDINGRIINKNGCFGIQQFSLNSKKSEIYIIEIYKDNRKVMVEKLLFKN